MKISIIVPVFNGGDALMLLYKETLEIEKINGAVCELIFLFDCGNIYSMKILENLRKLDPARVNVYFLKENYGQHKALLFGISKSSGDYIITMDDDLQQSPEDIIKLLNKQKDGNFDIVYGNYLDQSHPLMRIIASRVVKKLLSWSISDLYKGFSSFRLIKRDVANHLLEIKKPNYDFIDVKLGQISSNISEIRVIHKKSQKPESAYTWHKLFRHLLLIIITYSKIIRVLFTMAGFSIIMSLVLLLFSQENLILEPLKLALGFIGGIFFLSGIVFLMIKRGEERKYKPIDSINYTE
jgi:glycosyltransferase involved in cell wall biosynthesis